jgi:3-oxoacyl-[acyl-carrier protein] reductase
MAKTISNAYGPHGITVNNVCPGYTLTDRVRNLAAKRAEAEGMTVEEVLADFAAKTPAGRVGQPEELAAMVTFLASTRAAYVNGTTIQVDGGRVGCLL